MEQVWTLSAVADLGGFRKVAARMLREGKIALGRSESFESLEGLTCMIFDPTERLRAVLRYSDGTFVDQRTREELSSLDTRYRGMYQIWVEELK